MGETQARINLSSQIPTIIMMCGLQGAGKTTHAGKLAKHFKDQGKRPMLIAADIYRPAAIQQLQVVGERAGVPVFEMGQIDPQTIVKKGLMYAKDHGRDIAIIDTAGRLHIDEQLKSFDEALGIDGVILTKLDGDTRGGAALSVRAVTGKPIKFVGMGEKIEDLEPFYPDRMASRILGMGDMLTLIEKAQGSIDQKSAMSMAQKMKANSFDLNDLLEQMRQIHKMGPLQQVLSMIPGVSGKIKDEEVSEGEKELKLIETVINSMTKKEREKPSILNASRKRRIAAGSGTRVEDVNRVLRKFEQMQKMMKMVTGATKKGKRRMNPFGQLPPGMGM